MGCGGGIEYDDGTAKTESEEGGYHIDQHMKMQMCSPVHGKPFEPE